MGSIVDVKGPGGRPAFRAFVRHRGVSDTATCDTKTQAREWITRTEAATIAEGRHPRQQAADMMRTAVTKKDPVGAMVVDENPFAELEILGGAGISRTRVFKGDERNRFLSALTECGNPQMVLGGRFAVASGLRRGEVRRDRIPLTAAMRVVLDEVQPDPARRVGIVFCGLSYNSIGLAFKRVRRRTGISDMRWHDLRHVAATDASAATGGNAFLISLLTRHKDPSQVARYVNHGLGELAAALDAAAA